jgi:tetratricopeptide (TPR) repeat protein
MTHPDSETLYLAATGRLNPDTAALMSGHLAECPPCAESERELRALGEGLAESENLKLAEVFQKEERAPKQFPYELVGLSSQEAQSYAERLLATPAEDREALVQSDRRFLDSQTFYAAAKIVVAQTERQPQPALLDALYLHKLAARLPKGGGQFDDRNYVLGEMALTVARAYRVLDQTELAERWLDTAEKSFKATINPAPSMARAKLVRVVIRLHQRREQEALALCQDADPVLTRYEMQDELWRSRFLKATCLDSLGRSREAIPLLEHAIEYFQSARNQEFAARALQALANIYADSGAFAKATPLMESAAEYFRETGNRVALLQVKWGIAEAVRVSGNLRTSVPLFEEIIQGYFDLEMPNWAAGLRLIQAETLLQLDRPAEAEWQVRQALPYLDHPDARPEATAAILLLKRALATQKLDADTVRKSRAALETLQPRKPGRQ